MRRTVPRRLLALIAGLAMPVAMLTTTGAAPAAAADPPAPDTTRFQKVLLEDQDLTQPMRLKVTPDGRVIYIERDGRVKVWDPATKNSVVAGTVPVRVTGEHGLIGVALAPDFETSGHIYLHFARPDWNTSYTARVSRFTLSDENVLDLSSEVPIIDIKHPDGVGGGHSAGDMLFTPDGDLFIVTGDNTNCCASLGYPPTDERPGRGSADAQKTAANTNDLNGKVLRIHPLPEGGYSIPEGNLFAPGTEKTRPEIYAMGLRNPFTLGDWDPATKTLWIADYGPDAILPNPDRGPAGHVRLFLLKGPGNLGWPYCTMNNVPYNDWDYVNDKPREWFDCDNLVNDSPNNTGLTNLPPAVPATIYYTYDPQEYFPELFGGGAMAGPQYHYDADNPSTTKFPEWFDGRRFLYDWTTNWIQTAKFDESLSTPVDMQRFLPDMDFSKPMDMDFGPDGSLYVLEYGNGWGSSNDDAGLYRIDYVEGNRTPAVHAETDVDSGPLPLTVNFDASRSTDPDGDALTYSWDFDGDGTPDASGVRVSHTFATAGNHAVRLTVTDANGASAVANLSIVAGNTRPTVTIESPVDGTFSEFGTPIPFKVKVTDPEDGVVDCTKVKVTYLLGHNEHGHPMGEATPDANCEGTIVPERDAAHGTNSYVFHIVQASYTDAGGATGTATLTGETDAVLHPRQYAASTYPHGEGVGLFFGRLFAPASGNWFMFPRINVADVDRFNVEISTRMAGANFTVHADSPTGPVVARIDNLPSTGAPDLVNWRPTWFTTDVTDPGGVHDLYFVADWRSDVQPEFFVRNFQFVTDPESVTATVDPGAPNGANGWYTTAPKVTLSTGDAVLWNRQFRIVTNANQCGAADATWTNAAADGSVTLGEGTNVVCYRAADAAGNVVGAGNVTVRVDTRAPSATLPGVAEDGTIGDDVYLVPGATARP
jgi:glucose/arabinose dehydrogenase/PKD repeat protein